MDAKKVVVAYYDEFGVWTHVAQQLASRLPLRNLEWRSQRQTVRTIPVLNVEFKRYASGTIQSENQKPFLNIYLVNCHDFETYKTVVRKKIGAWVEQIKAKRHQECLIVYVSTDDSRAKNTANFLSMRGSVFDKIRTDFGSTRSTHLRLYEENRQGDNEIWQDIITKMKEGIISSFDRHVLQYEDDIRKIDMQREFPGWNYCNFFILKEGLAHVYETMNLNEDALTQYDELNTSFFQTVKNLPNEIRVDTRGAWAQNFGATEPGDENADLLNVAKKPYRDLIMQNNINIFDFRSYLFGRQCQLLSKLNRPVDICERAQQFINSFARSIKSRRHQLCDNFLESWIYSSCMNIVKECQELVLSAKYNSMALKSFDAAKAELLHYARQQLDKLGIWHQLLPAVLPFSMYLEQPSGGYREQRMDGRNDKQEFANADLQLALSSEDEFDKLYMSMSTRAMKAYEASDRLRSVWFLNGDVAALMFHRGLYVEAGRILGTVDSRYSKQGWVVIENTLLSMSAFCHKHLGENSKYVTKCLSLIENTTLTSEETEFYTTELIQAAANLTEDIQHDMSSLFTVKILSKNDDEEKVQIQISITSNLPKPFTFDELSLQLASTSDGSNSVFSFSKGSLQPGKNTFSLSCEGAEHGTYVVESFQMQTGRLLFTRTLLDLHNKRRFRINENPTSLKVVVTRPRTVALNEQRSIQIAISTRKCQIKEGWLRVTGMNQNLTFPLVQSVKASITPCDSTTVTRIEELTTKEDGGINLPKCNPNEVISLCLPYALLSQTTQQNIKTHVEFIGENDQNNIYRAVKLVQLAMPFKLSYRTYIRDACLFLKVDVHANADTPLCLANARVKSSPQFQIVGHPAAQTNSTMLFPSQRMSYLYRIVPQTSQELSASNEVQFFVDYRCIADEVIQTIVDAIVKLLPEKGIAQHAEYIKTKMYEYLQNTINARSYSMTDGLQLGELDVSFFQHVLIHDEAETQEAILSLLRHFYADNRKSFRGPDEHGQELIWDTVIFPMEINIYLKLIVVELQMDNEEKDLIVAGPCPCRITIHWSNNWGPRETELRDTSMTLSYEVGVDCENWLLCGRRRMQFDIKRGETKSFPVALVPIRTGLILLPPITIQSMAELGDVAQSPSAEAENRIAVETVYNNGAEQVLVLPRTRSKTVMIDPIFWTSGEAPPHSQSGKLPIETSV